jgi:hypothetical protein
MFLSIQLRKEETFVKPEGKTVQSSLPTNETNPMSFPFFKLLSGPESKQNKELV